MSASYRLIHFSPDPFTGARFPLGAVVADAQGEVRVARVERLPSADCLGDRRLAVAVQRLHARLGAVTTVEALPAVFGPYATLAEPQEVPKGVPDALAWVQGMLAPTAAQEAHLVTPRSRRRATLGYRFFQTWGVQRYVRKTFKPATDWGGWLDSYSALPQISHWVPGQNQVLLMEPVVPTRRQFEQDVGKIAMRLGAYRHAMEHASNGREGSLLAYITAGGRPDMREMAMEQLQAFAHDVVDTEDATSRDGFIERIRRVGGEGRQQELIDAK